ncbi:random slug protein 5-like [Phalaenopsis equestris]|uniref:random slug protein 5-like n=1 Tax=Phalaenopsis equestris TaxID=78828 RepID=UPI0009E449F5|nr:random slug protein 5-like [Phalaenopsis equestris]XP_020583037.1 random slug protein 5-like [Phalaenopsis equestris]
MSLRRSKSSRAEKVLSVEEQQQKINEVRKLIAPLSDNLPEFCSDASISRFLRARNWNSDKAGKMFKEALKWRLEYRPELIRWEDIADEAKTGKIYRADYQDKFGRPVLVMRPGFQNTNAVKGQIKYLVYCMENAILNLGPDQEQMVWLIDFQGWTKVSVSVKATRETANVLQGYYPERLAVGILYNPPKIFEPFWKMVKPFIEQKTYKKVKFVYSDNPESQKIMLDLFDTEKLESTFGGRNQNDFNYSNFADRMKEDDKKMAALLSSGGAILSPDQPPRRSISFLSDAHIDNSSEGSTSTDPASPKLEKNGVNGMSDCETNVGPETQLQIEGIQIKETI